MLHELLLSVERYLAGGSVGWVSIESFRAMTGVTSFGILLSYGCDRWLGSKGSSARTVDRSVECSFGWRLSFGILSIGMLRVSIGC